MDTLADIRATARRLALIARRMAAGTRKLAGGRSACGQAPVRGTEMVGPPSRELDRRAYAHRAWFSRRKVELQAVARALACGRQSARGGVMSRGGGIGVGVGTGVAVRTGVEVDIGVAVGVGVGWTSTAGARVVDRAVDGAVAIAAPAVANREPRAVARADAGARRAVPVEGFPCLIVCRELVVRVGRAGQVDVDGRGLAGGHTAEMEGEHPVREGGATGGRGIGGRVREGDVAERGACRAGDGCGAAAGQWQALPAGRER